MVLKTYFQNCTTLVLASEIINPGYFVKTRYRAELVMTDLQIEAQAEQYAQVLQVKKTFDVLNRLQLLASFRPRVPVKGHARIWWKYAIHSVFKPKTSIKLGVVRLQLYDTFLCIKNSKSIQEE